MSMDVRLYITLAATVALYAILLHHTKELLEPDLTWLEVVIGCAICLAFAAWRQRLLVETPWQEYERGVWLAFLVGGGVIIFWQVGRFIRRQQELRRRGSTSTEAMAEQCRGSATADDRER